MTREELDKNVDEIIEFIRKQKCEKCKNECDVCGFYNTFEELYNIINEYEKYKNADLIERKEAIKVATAPFRYDGKFGLEEWRTLEPNEIKSALENLPHFEPKGE